MPKKNNNDLLREITNKIARIDERTGNTQENTKEIKENQKEIFNVLKSHSGKIKVIEAEHRKPFHQGTILGFVRLLFGR